MLNLSGCWFSIEERFCIAQILFFFFGWPPPRYQTSQLDSKGWYETTGDCWLIRKNHHFCAETQYKDTIFKKSKPVSTGHFPSHHIFVSYYTICGHWGATDDPRFRITSMPFVVHVCLVFKMMSWLDFMCAVAIVITLHRRALEKYLELAKKETEEERLK